MNLRCVVESAGGKRKHKVSVKGAGERGEQSRRFTYAVGSTHTDTGTTEFREAGYGDHHQIDITGSGCVNEGKDIDGW